MKPIAAQISLTDRLAALSEELRLRLLRVLEREELTVGEAASVVQLPQSTVSRHLKILSEAGWLDRRTDGPATLYALRLDDLSPDSRSLWIAVRDQMGDSASLEEDLRRLDAVVADRRTDSVSFFGRVAGEWDDLRTQLFGTGFTAAALLALLPSDWVVADLGCGTGNAAELLASHVSKVIAIDRSPQMLDAARKRLAGLENVELREGTLERLPLSDSSVDATTCVLVLHYLDDPLAALREMSRVLKPGGTAIVIDMTPHDRAIYRSTMGHIHLGFAEQEIKQLMHDAGLASVSVQPLPRLAEARGPGLFVARGRKGSRA